MSLIQLFRQSKTHSLTRHTLIESKAIRAIHTVKRLANEMTLICFEHRILKSSLLPGCKISSLCVCVSHLQKP